MAPGLLSSIGKGLKKVSGTIGRINRSVGSVLGPIMQTAGTIASIYNVVTNPIGAILGGTGGLLGGMGFNVAQSAQAETKDTGGFLDSIKAEVLGAIDAAISRVGAFINSTIVNVGDWIKGTVDNIGATVGASVDRLSGGVNGLLRDVSSTLSSLGSSVAGAVERATAPVMDAIRGFISAVDDRLGGFFEQAKAVYDNMVDAITGALGPVIEQVGSVVDSVKTTLSDVIDRTVVAVSNVTAGISETIASIPEFLRKFLPEVMDNLAGSLGVELEKVPAAFSDSLYSLFGGVAEAEADKVAQANRLAVFSEQLTPLRRERLDELFSTVMPQTPVAKWIFNVVLGGFIVFFSAFGIIQANAQIALQEWGRTNPFQVLAPPDAATAFYRGLIDRDTALDEMRRQGYSEQAASVLLESAVSIAPEGELLSWWLRGLTDDATLEAGLRGKGYNDEAIANFKQASFFIPPVQDIITMAVREVFTPATAEKFGQFEDFPQAFADWAAKQGVSEQWARNYWAAHWVLPSPQQGFEMLHRGVITQDELSMLLKALDVMPFWREKLTKISYNPITRVDIRRLHKMGIFDRDRVKRAYLDIGYNPEDAESLTEFTEQLNAPKPLFDDVKVRELTRSNIVDFYKRGLLSRADAEGMLVDAGYAEEAAALYLNSVDLEQEQQSRDEAEALILEQAAAGVITFDEAQDALHALGLETVELTRALTKLTRQEARRTKLPSKDELRQMVKKKIISVETYKDTMKRLGYADVWVDRYAMLI